MLEATRTLDRACGAGPSVCLVASLPLFMKRHRRKVAILTFVLFVTGSVGIADTCGYKWTCNSSSCAQNLGAWSGVASKSDITLAECETVRKQQYYINSQPCQCPPGGTAQGTTPSVSGLTSQQQLGMQIGMLGANMIGQGLKQLLSGPPPTPVDPAQQQRQLAAQQLNNSGVYLLKQKNYTGAINLFQQALANTPNDANILHNLALARQQLKDTAVAGKTSGALGQLLGTDSASPVPSNVNAPGSALSSIDLNSDPNVVDLHGATKTSVDPALLKGQLDAALGNDPPVSAQSNSQVVLPQDKDMELLSTLSEPGRSQSQVVVPQDKDIELLSTLSEPGTSQSQVVLPQDKDMELLSTLSQPGPSQSHVVVPQDKDMELLGAPPSSGEANSKPASRPSKTTPASDPSLRDAPNDDPTPASKGTGKCTFGTTCNPTNPDLNPSASAPPVAVHSANDQASSAARSGAAATANARSDGAKVESGCGFDTYGCASPIPMNNAVLQTPRAPANIQIPASMANDPEVRLLNRYKQQTQDAYKAAAAAQAKFEAEQKRNPQSSQLPVLQEQAKEAQDKAGSLDRMVTFQTGEVQKKIKFAAINTGDNGTPASPPNN